MFGWGATEMIVAASRNYDTMLGLRFLLGAFEAAGIDFENLRLSLIMAAGPLSGALGGCIAYARMRQETSKSLGHAVLTWDGAKSTLRDWRHYFNRLVCILVFVPTTNRYRMWSMWSMVSIALAGVTFIVQGALPPTSFKTRYYMLYLETTFIYASCPSFPIWLTGILRDANATTLAIPMNIASRTFGNVTGVLLDPFVGLAVHVYTSRLKLRGTRLDTLRMVQYFW
ncbi:hypothetical protein DFS33DRAFT_1451019 [Desarmillaria ectypa]|nr:hypothetical protein DFS33DRAFT_1451019 [Desarmillaria ectypa]